MWLAGDLMCLSAAQNWRKSSGWNESDRMIRVKPSQAGVQEELVSVVDRGSSTLNHHSSIILNHPPTRSGLAVAPRVVATLIQDFGEENELESLRERERERQRERERERKSWSSGGS